MMRINSFLPLRCSKSLVFFWAASRSIPAEEDGQILGKLIPVTEAGIEQWFCDDPIRRSRFLIFLSAGCQGVIRVEGGRWISYAWMSPPGSRVGPEQIPARLRLPYHWIYYCRTLEKYQGKGLYKANLRALIRLGAKSGWGDGIVIDTEPSNISSRKAILSVGFVPKGIIHTKKLIIPGIRAWTWGGWVMQEKHP